MHIIGRKCADSFILTEAHGRRENQGSSPRFPPII
nr:MAG TPA: hypothetical protein [Caudoviricetes sp.]